MSAIVGGALLGCAAEAAAPPSAEVAAALGRLREGDARAEVAAAIARFGDRRAAVLAALDARGLPRAFAAVPIVESRYRNLGEAGVVGESAAPGQRGAGVWMFIPATARRYGLRVDDEADERLDEAKETAAAAHLLADLMAEFGDEALALDGYNEGEQHVRRAIAEQGTRDPWELTRRGAINGYAADVLAAARALDDPSLVAEPEAP
ncbi:MAG TPA: transglycosylase SLT domain-containing protein [Byssovorax sp.]|jgi:hypothetical protein